MTTTKPPTVNQILQHLNKVGRGIERGALGTDATLDAMEQTGLVDVFGTLVYLTPKGRQQIVSDDATVLVVEPGNGTRYCIVHGTAPDGSPFVALPDFGVAATCSPHPVEAGYLAEKLKISMPDAEAVFAALNPDRGVQ